MKFKGDKMTKFIDWEAFKESIETYGKLVIRPSGVQQFISCPAQWFRVHVLKDFQRPSAAASLGTSLHKGAEVGYEEKINTGKLPPLSVLEDAAVYTWKACNEQDLEYNEGESFNTMQNDLLTGINSYYNEVMVSTTPQAVEQRYTIEIDSPIVESISGTIDIDLPNGLADIKVTKKKTTASKYIVQQSLYALLKEHNSEPCQKASIHNVVRGKSVEVLDLQLSKDYVKRWVNIIIDTLEKFDETKDPLLFRGCSPTSNFLCSPNWCGYWNICPFVKGL